MVGLAQPIVRMSEAQAYVRIETGEEEAVLAALIRTASGLCEAFINQVVVARAFECDLPATGCWERLPITPVRSITDVAAIDFDGSGDAAVERTFSVDIDYAGDGWVRIARPDVNPPPRLRKRGNGR